MDMSISTLAVNASSIDTSSAVGLAMVKKSLEAMDMQGENMKQIMEASVTPYLGQNVDISI